MSNPLFGFVHQAFSSSCPIGLLPEDAEITLAIRLKCDALPVRGPDRIAIGASQRELPRRGGAGKVDDPDVGVLAVVCRNCNPLAVWRNSRKGIRFLWQLQPLKPTALAVHRCEGSRRSPC